MILYSRQSFLLKRAKDIKNIFEVLINTLDQCYRQNEFFKSISVVMKSKALLKSKNSMLVCISEEEVALVI